ncbi:MAG TPA: peroxiredoxin [Candidatus Hydrogenedentes bacterium]|nr:peroxiredoxin [Candidatus Hydrogenedentota bacterium]HOL75784.1 peroxiredoxin [Candidatus Hydrogenedentota bacterium]HPO84222.1 peroxiredoxin [Candidatus Hydrogenedentota bacterium]
MGYGMSHIALGFAFSFLLCAPNVQNTDKKDDDQPQLDVGMVAPDFEFVSGKNPEGKPIKSKLSDFRGKKNVLVAFYPKAFTPGCTKQLCGYRDDFEELSKLNLQIIAVSADNQEDSDKFKEHYNYPFPVVGDPEHKIIEAYNVPTSSSGNATRCVFLVDKQGRISYIDKSYQVDNEKEPLYEALKKLNSSD